MVFVLFPQKQKNSITLSTVTNYSILFHIANCTNNITALEILERVPEFDPPEDSCSFVPSRSIVGDKVRRFSAEGGAGGSVAIMGIPEAVMTDVVGLSLLPSVGIGFPSLDDPPDCDSSAVVGFDSGGPSVAGTLGVPIETSAGAVLVGVGGDTFDGETGVGEDPLCDGAFEGGDPLGDESSGAGEGPLGDGSAGVGEDPLGEATGT